MVEVFVSVLGSVLSRRLRQCGASSGQATHRHHHGVVAGRWEVSTTIEAGGGKTSPPAPKRALVGPFPPQWPDCALRGVHTGPIGGTALGAPQRHAVPHSAADRPNRRYQSGGLNRVLVVEPTLATLAVPSWVRCNRVQRTRGRRNAPTQRTWRDGSIIMFSIGSILPTHRQPPAPCRRSYGAEWGVISSEQTMACPVVANRRSSQSRGRPSHHYCPERTESEWVRHGTPRRLSGRYSVHGWPQGAPLGVHSDHPHRRPPVCITTSYSAQPGERSSEGAFSPTDAIVVTIAVGQVVGGKVIPRGGPWR